MDRIHAFAWVLPDEGRQDRFDRRCVNRDGFPDRGCLPSMRDLFASAELAFRLGVDAPRAASRILACPHARRFHQRGPGPESEVGAPTHRSRIARRLFHPRLRLRPRFLAGEEGSTPWTRSPFTPRPPRGGPGHWTGEGASMRPAVVAYRLLQPKKSDVRAHSRAVIPAARRGPQPSSRFVPRGDSSL